MKSVPRFSVIAAIVATIALAGCKDDVYEPGKIRPIPPAENPFGEDFKAPDGFDWSMDVSIKLSVEVDDEFTGKYDYLIEVFTAHPLNNTSIIPIAAGYANSDQKYTAEINLSKSVTRLYIRKTDPKQRSSIYEYTVPQNGGTLNCKLFYTAATTRATIGTSGWDIVNPKIKEYGEEQATDISDMTEKYEFVANDQLKDGSVYIIKKGETFNKNLTTNQHSRSVIVIVKGTWNITSQRPQHLTIYVADGGKITGTPHFDDGCTLEVQAGGAVHCTEFDAYPNVPIRNFGSIKVEDKAYFNSGSSLYNAKGATVVIDELDMNTGTTLKNFGTMSIEDFEELNSGGVIYNAEGATFTLDDGIKLNSSQILNHGQMNIAGTLETNSNLETIIANYGTGILIADEIEGGGIFINDNYIEAKEFDMKNHTDAPLYNNCTIIAKEEFKFTQVVIDHGSITGSRNGDSWSGVPVESYNEGSLTLLNGSIIKATTFTCGKSLNVNADGNSPSMIQAEKITYSNTTLLKGNLILDINAEVNAGSADKSGEPQYEKDPSVKTTTPSGTAEEAIETCSGIIYPGNEGSSTPETPEYPEEVGDAQGYTYAFEDQWPIYGDYDMNDIVLTIDEIKLSVKKEHGDEYVKEAKIKGRVKAVGASRTLGIGIQLIGLPSDVKTSQLKQNGETISFEDENFHPTLIICEDAHRYMDNTQQDNTFINTEIGGKTDEYKNFDFAIKFAGQDAKPENFNINHLDVFIFSKKGAQVPYRREVHLAGNAPTRWGDQSFSGASNDDNSNRFTSHENLAWGIRIPYNEWSWPQELIIITDVYRDFEGWVSSGGASNADWWKNNNIDKDKLYHR